MSTVCVVRVCVRVTVNENVCVRGDEYVYCVCSECV